ncbi:putative major facilitator, sugar transporter, major facilitator superfamily [Plasmopara halstedii]
MNKFLVRGLGFFNDAYDLFVMNIVNVVLTEQYGKDVYTSSMKSWVSAGALIGAVVGQLLFGFLGDVFGRRVNMIATCALLIIGGTLCTVAYGGTDRGTLWFLVVARFILGIGIGGEYPLAASSTAEDATSVANRNQRVALTFSLQGVGSLTAAILGNLIIQALADGEKNENPDSRLETVWRLLFGIGVIPAIVVCYWRVTAEETDAYKAIEERRNAATIIDPLASRARILFIIRHYGVSLLGTAGTWFLFDIVFYAQNLFSASILSVVGVKNASLQVVSAENAFVALMALPGYFVAVYFINRLGRKIIQLQGFAVMTVLFLVLAIFWENIKKKAVLFIILYGLALFFSNFGPNMSTFVMPTEMFPTPIRSTCHGVSAAAGKAGAAIGTFGFSIWVENDSFGYDGAFYTFAAITLVSIPLTWFCLFDNEKGFEDMDAEFYKRVYASTDITRASFSSVGKGTDVEKDGAYKNIHTPQ